MRTIIIFISFFVFSLTSYAHNLTIIYTGNSYSSLYPCGHCPASVGGGVARRATIIKDIKSRAKNVLIIDAGNFTAGGNLDENSINPQMDEKRSISGYEIMQAMGYDAVGIGENEFNFGENFLKTNIKKSKLNAISSNLKIDGILPYYIKEFPGFKVGIIGLSPQTIAKKTTTTIEGYDTALSNAIAEIKNKVDLIILLSSLGDEANSYLANKFPDVKLIIASGNMLKQDEQEKIKNTIILKPSYLAKELRFANLDIKTNNITKLDLQKKRLELSIKEAPAIVKMIPRCFADSNCSKKDDLVATCQNPGLISASCAYLEPNPIDALLISDTNCQFCLTDASRQLLKELFVGINFRIINYTAQEAKEAIKKYSITSLPAFIISNEVKREKNFAQIEKFTGEKDNKIILKPQLSGLFLFLNRKEIPRRLDFFINLQDASSISVLSGLLDFCKKEKVHLNIYFVVDKNKTIGYPQEEMRIALTIQNSAPDKFFEYLKKRLADVKNTSWMDSADAVGIDSKKIKDASKSKTTAKLIDENNKVVSELDVNYGNVMLVNNNRIFQVFQIKAEDLEKLVKK
ncbi:MAG: hypothetical protein WC546_01330 [Candidatus Omnitrophota bacterium]